MSEPLVPAAPTEPAPPPPPPSFTPTEPPPPPPSFTRVAPPPPPPSPRPPAGGPGTRLRRNALALTIGFAGMVGAMVFSFFVLPIVYGRTGWLEGGKGGDVWVQWRAASLLTFRSGYAHVFHFDGLLKTPPGWEVLVSPIARAAFWLNYPIPVADRYPHAWLVVGPLDLAPMLLCTCAADFWMRRIGTDRARRVVVLGMLCFVLPMASFWGHPEDLMALGCGLYALAAARDGRAVAGGWWMSAALCFQIEAVLFVPLCLVLLARGTRWSFLLRSAVLSVAVMIVPLVGDPGESLRAIFEQKVFPGLPRYAPIKELTPHSATVANVLIVLLAVLWAVLAARLRPRLTDQGLVWLAGLVYCGRLLEPSIYPYYLIGAWAVLLVAVAPRPWWRVTAQVVLVGFSEFWVGHIEVHGSWWRWLSDVVLVVLAAWIASPRALTEPRAVPGAETMAVAPAPPLVALEMDRL